jgi:glycosyltransferase involved in cell wall biosynthesis
LVDAVVEGQTGLLFSAGNIDELSNLMIRLMGDRQLVSDLGSQAKSRAEAHFNADRLYSALKEFYLDEASRADLWVNG